MYRTFRYTLIALEVSYRAMAKILISLKDEFLTEIDKIANNELCSRSEIIREALRYYMRTRIREQAKLSVDSLLIE